MAEPEVDVHDGQPIPQDALAVRERVFVEEQDVSKDLEFDGLDGDAVHAVARSEGDPIGTARLRWIDASTGRIERVAVLAPHRGSGTGRELMDALESVATDHGRDRIVLHAQVTAEGFYRSLGYETVSGVFEEAGMDHVEMEKRLEGD